MKKLSLDQVEMIAAIKFGKGTNNGVNIITAYENEKGEMIVEYTTDNGYGDAYRSFRFEILPLKSEKSYVIAKFTQLLINHEPILKDEEIIISLNERIEYLEKMFYGYASEKIEIIFNELWNEINNSGLEYRCEKDFTRNKLLELKETINSYEIRGEKVKCGIKYNSDVKAVL